jgi:ribosomal 30S subunit maturation factor RimM
VARRVVLGRVSGLYGVRGWVKVFSETEPLEGILGYTPWLIGTGGVPRQVLEGRRHGKGVVVRLEGCTDRDQAASLVGAEIAVSRNDLPPASADELFWWIETPLDGRVPLWRTSSILPDGIRAHSKRSMLQKCLPIPLHC